MFAFLALDAPTWPAGQKCSNTAAPNGTGRRPGGAVTDGMVMDKWREVPGTLSNLGSGFDVFGLASGSRTTGGARRISDRGVVIEGIEGPGASSITTDPTRNSPAFAARASWSSPAPKFGVALRIKKGIRPCSGIGSSELPRREGACAANLILDTAALRGASWCAAAKAEQAHLRQLHADICRTGGARRFTVIRS